MFLCGTLTTPQNNKKNVKKTVLSAHARIYIRKGYVRGSLRQPLRVQGYVRAMYRISIRAMYGPCTGYPYGLCMGYPYELSVRNPLTPTTAQSINMRNTSTAPIEMAKNADTNPWIMICNSMGSLTKWIALSRRARRKSLRMPIEPVRSPYR